MAPPGGLAQEIAALLARLNIEQNGMRMTPLNRQDVPSADDAVRLRRRRTRRGAP
jgi:hypothetical protein